MEELFINGSLRAKSSYEKLRKCLLTLRNFFVCSWNQ